MKSRLIVLALLLCFFRLNSFSQLILPKTVEQLVGDLQSNNRELSDSAVQELPLHGRKALPETTVLATQLTTNSIIRARAIIVLGKIKDQSSVSVLVNLLKDKDSYIRGTSAYALSQIGGEKARTPLLMFLKNCLRQDQENLSRVTEAFVYLPDARAFPLLLKIVNIAFKQKTLPESRNQANNAIQINTLRYAIEALGKIGDSRASEPIARFLDPSINYIDSQDYFYLKAISQTRGKQVIPYLIRYLEKIVQKMKAEAPEQNVDITSTGFENRQRDHNIIVYRQTIECLENITGQRTTGMKPDERLLFWQDYLKSKNVNPER